MIDEFGAYEALSPHAVILHKPSRAAVVLPEHDPSAQRWVDYFRLLERLLGRDRCLGGGQP